MRERWADEITARARAHWTDARTAELARGKALILPPADAAPLLRALGLLRADASMPPDRVRKFFQVNHMVALLGPALRELRAAHAEIELIDAGCGRSYLSLILAWVARHVWKQRLVVRGVDRNADVIDECRKRAELALLDDVATFEVGDVAAVAGDAHGVIALHACDTATCDAIALGVALGAEMIAVAPCCQAELARAWATSANGAFAPIHAMPHLRRETAAMITDAMRTLLLRGAGYEVLAMEFVPSEHTRKNTLIRAIKRAPDPSARAEYDALVAATGGAGLALATRVPGG
ncbi:MAG TPA: SAM-dependent methyltransferase [Kofleriaceae bacterium]|nr:SAM-dependent methyltransferase [Kofleriaceae bacterium]